MKCEWNELVEDETLLTFMVSEPGLIFTDRLKWKNDKIAYTVVHAYLYN